MPYGLGSGDARNLGDDDPLRKTQSCKLFGLSSSTPADSLPRSRAPPASSRPDPKNARRHSAGYNRSRSEKNSELGSQGRCKKRSASFTTKPSGEVVWTSVGRGSISPAEARGRSRPLLHRLRPWHTAREGKTGAWKFPRRLWFSGKSPQDG